MGAATNEGDQALLPFLWNRGVMTNLGTLDGEPCSTGQGLNSNGQVVGYTCISGGRGHAWLWEHGVIIDLNTLIPPESLLTLEIAENINNRGEIAGLGRLPGCDDAFDCGHAFLLLPICGDGSEGCADAPLDPAIVAQSRAPQKQLTPQEISRIRALLMNRHRGFMPRTMH